MKTISNKKTLAKKDASAGFSPGLVRGLEILELLSRHPNGRTLSEIAVQLELPNASVFRICNDLEQLEYLTRDSDSKRFVLTNKLLRMGQPAGQDRLLSECSLPSMREVRRLTSETTQLCCLVDTEMVIVEQLLAIHPFKYSAELGARCPLYSCAPGKAITAFLAEEDQEQLVQRIKFKRFTDNTIVGKARFREELASIRINGFAVDRGEGLRGVHCVAAPILDRYQIAIAAITIAAPAERVPESMFAEIGQLMIRAATTISRAFNS